MICDIYTVRLMFVINVFIFHVIGRRLAATSNLCLLIITNYQWWKDY